MRAGIVGCGGIAQVHARVLSQMDDAVLVAAADIRPERAKALTEKFGGTAYASLEKMLAHEQINVLHICTPHSLHTPMAQLAAEKGIAVFTEKPPVVSEAQWREFSALGEKIPVGICFQNRYNGAVRHIKELMDAGKTGGLKGARAFVTWSRDAAYYTESGWRGSLVTEGGGVLINQSIHTMDLLVYLLGAPKTVEATAGNHHLKGVIEVEDTMQAYWQLGTAPVLFYATTAYSMDAPVLVELHFEKVVLRMENTSLCCTWENGKREDISFSQEAVGGKAYWGTGHGICIREFYESLAQGKPIPIGIAQVKDTMRVMLQAYSAARKAAAPCSC